MISPRRWQINAAAAALLAYALLRGLLLSAIVPPWQGPDEPGHFEYALLLSARAAAALGAAEAAPATGDPRAQAPIVRSLREHAFYRHTAAPVPPPGASRFEDVPRLGTEVIQDGDETPVGYVPYGAALAIVPAGDVAEVLLHLRLVTVALVLVLGWLSWRVAAIALPPGAAAAAAAAALVVAGPMVGFAGAVVSPDLAAAVLVAAWFAASAQRLLPTGEHDGSPGAVSWPRVAWRRVPWVLVAWTLVMLAAAAKRTALFAVPLAIGLEIALARRGAHGRQRFVAAVAAVTALVLALALAFGAGQLRGQAAGWQVVGVPWGDVRVETAARDGGWGLRIVDHSPDGWQYVQRWVEIEPPSGGGSRRIEATAWLRRAAGGPAAGDRGGPVAAEGEGEAPATSDGDGEDETGAPAELPERASLVVDAEDGLWLADVVDLPGDGGWVHASVSGDVPGSAASVRIAIVPGDGTLEGVGAVDVDDVTLRLDGAPIDVNGSAERPVRRGAAWTAWLARYTAAERILASAGWAGFAVPAVPAVPAPGAALDRAASALAFTFRSAWGGFGWLTLWPGRAHYMVAGLVTAFTGIAWALALVAPARLAADPARARYFRLCAIGALLAVVVAIVGSVAGAAAHKQPQGRYLIPALLPLALPAAALAERLAPGRGPGALAALVIGLDLAAIGWVIWPGFE